MLLLSGCLGLGGEDIDPNDQFPDDDAAYLDTDGDGEIDYREFVTEFKKAKATTLPPKPAGNVPPHSSSWICEENRHPPSTPQPVRLAPRGLRSSVLCEC